MKTLGGNDRRLSPGMHVRQTRASDPERSGVRQTSPLISGSQNMGLHTFCQHLTHSPTDIPYLVTSVLRKDLPSPPADQIPLSQGPRQDSRKAGQTEKDEKKTRDGLLSRPPLVLSCCFATFGLLVLLPSMTVQDAMTRG